MILDTKVEVSLMVSEFDLAELVNTFKWPSEASFVFTWAFGIASVCVSNHYGHTLLPSDMTFGMNVTSMNVLWNESYRTRQSDVCDRTFIFLSFQNWGRFVVLFCSYGLTSCPILMKFGFNILIQLFIILLYNYV